MLALKPAHAPRRLSLACLLALGSLSVALPAHAAPQDIGPNDVVEPALEPPRALESPEAAPPAAPAEPATKELLLVLPLVGDADQALMALANQQLAKGARDGGRHTVTTFSELRASLEAQTADALGDGADCDAEGCMTKLAQAANAPFVVGGSLRPVGAEVLVSLLLVDARDGSRVGSVQRKLPDQPLLVERTVERLAKSLVTGAPPPNEASVLVVVDGGPKEVAVAVDGGEPASYTSPFVLDLPAGAHTISVAAGSGKAFETELELAPGSASVLRPRLSAPRVALWPAAAALGVAGGLAASAAVAFEVMAWDVINGEAVPFLYYSPEKSYQGLGDVTTAQEAQLEQESRRWTYTMLAAATTAGLLFGTAAVVATADVVLWSFEE